MLSANTSPVKEEEPNSFIRGRILFPPASRTDPATCQAARRAGTGWADQTDVKDGLLKQEGFDVISAAELLMKFENEEIDPQEMKDNGYRCHRQNQGQVWISLYEYALLRIVIYHWAQVISSLPNMSKFV